MCGGGGGGGSNDALEYQKEQDAERARNIENGKMQLERIFAGLEGDEYQIINPAATYSRDQYEDALRQALEGQTSRVRTGWDYAGTGNKYTDVKPSDWRYRRRIGASDNSGNQGSWYRPVYENRLSDRGRQSLLDLGLSESQINEANTDYDKYASYYKALVNSPGSYQRVEGVNDPIWEQQADAYLEYANPQLDDQYKDAREDMVYALQRQGQAESSLAGDRWADLERDYKLQQQGIAEKARGYANQAQNDIMSQKSSLLQTLHATADPGAVTSAARDAVANLGNTPSFSPLGPLFQNATAGLAAGIQGNQNYQIDQNTNQIVYGSDPDRGSGKVVR